MRRNKKFYQNKELRRLSIKHSKLHNERYGGRWNGYEFYLTLKKEAKHEVFKNDLRKALKYCSRTITQVSRGHSYFTYKERFDDETCKIFKGTVRSLLQVFIDKKIFEKRVPLKYRYMFHCVVEWTIEGWKPIDYHLNTHYIKLLEVHRRKFWQSSCNTLSYSDIALIDNKIQRENLYPKINRIFGCKRNYYDKYEIQRHIQRKDMSLRRQFQEELLEYTKRRRRYKLSGYHRETWEEFLLLAEDSGYYDPHRQSDLYHAPIGIEKIK